MKNGVELWYCHDNKLEKKRTTATALKVRPRALFDKTPNNKKRKIPAETQMKIQMNLKSKPNRLLWADITRDTGSAYIWETYNRKGQPSVRAPVNCEHWGLSCGMYDLEAWSELALSKPCTFRQPSYSTAVGNLYKYVITKTHNTFLNTKKLTAGYERKKSKTRSLSSVLPEAQAQRD